MKKRLFLGLLLIACVEIQAHAQVLKSFTLIGDVSKVSEQLKKVEISYTVNGKNIKDSADIKNGKYIVKGKIETPVLITIHAIPVKPIVQPIDQIMDQLLRYASFYAEPNHQMTLVHGSNFYDKKSTGSISEKELEGFEAASAAQVANMRKLFPEYLPVAFTQDTAKMRPYINQLEDIQMLRSKAIFDYTRHHLQSPIVLHFFNNIYGTNDEGILAQWFTKIPQNIKLSKEGKAFKLKMKLLIGNPAPDFIQADTLRNPVTLSSFRGKYVLVDFWASWCSPCRAENPNVVKAFNKFKDKNFMIISISEDSDIKPWLNAIHKDGLNLAGWLHLSDLKGHGNEVANLYGVGGIPANVLLDPSGKVVAKNIQGRELDIILTKIIK